MKRLLVSSETVWLIKQGASSLTIQDYMEESFPQGTEVILIDSNTGNEVATAIVTKNSRVHKLYDLQDREPTVDDQENITLGRIKMIK